MGEGLRRGVKAQAAIALIGSFAIILLLYLFFSWSFPKRPEYGGSYVEGVAGSPMAVNPLLGQFNDVDKDLVALLFSGLTRLGEEGEVLPDLAQGWEVSDDGRQYTFHLRSGVRWHDGVPFSAEDVLFTLQALKAPDFPGPPELAELWTRVRAEKKDELTLSFTLPEAFAPFLSYTNLGLLPAHLLRDVPAKALSESPFNASPIGTGPFKLKEASIGYVLLEANPEYYRGKPYLSSIKLRFYHDQERTLNALLDREVQGLLLRPVVEAKDMARLQKQKGLQLLSSPRSSYTIIFLNQRSPLFADRAVRQALLYALDRRRITQGPLAGQGLEADSPIPPGTWAYDSSIKRYGYDPAKARALLEAAGWTAQGQGLRQRDGQSLRFSLLTNEDKTRIKVGEEVVRELREVGISAELSASGYTELLQNYLLPRRFDAILYGMDTGYDPDGYVAWHSSQSRGNGFNFASFSNAEADAYLEKARSSTDPEKRAELYREFQSLFSEEVPSLLLYYPLYTYALDKSVQGVEMGVLFEPSSRFANVTEWYVKTKRVRR